MMSDAEIEEVLERVAPYREILIEAAPQSDAIWRNAYRMAQVTTQEALFLRNYLVETYSVSASLNKPR